MKKDNYFIGRMLLAVCVFLWMDGTSTAESEGFIDITVQETARIAGREIIMKDIATVQGDAEIVDKIERIVIGSAPLPGKERVLKRAHLITRLKQHKVDLKSTKFNCPYEIRISTLHKEFGQQGIEEIIKQYIHEHMPWNPNEVTIQDFAVRPFQIQEGNVTYRITVPKNENYLGRFSAQISFFVDGQFVRNVDVSAVIQVITPIVLSVQQIERRQVITEEDVTVEERDITHLAKDYVVSTHEVIGKRATCRIGADRIIKPAMIEEAPLIHKGDLITIFVETNTFRISTSGEALQDGRVGDMIEISNTSSNQKMYGYVKNSKEAEVRF